MTSTHYDSVNKIWSGSKWPSIYNSDVSVGYLVLNVLQNVPDSVTQVSADTGVEVTCRQMYQKSINIARYLQELHCNHGDRVGFAVSNTGEVAPTVFACLALGLPIISLFPAMIESEMIAAYSKIKPKLIFCDAEVIHKIEAVVTALAIDCLIITLDDKVDSHAFIGDITGRSCCTEIFEIPLFDSNSVAFIMPTSGSSGNVKFVCKSHKEIIQELAVQWKLQLSTQEIWLSFTTIFWITGVAALLQGTLYGAKRVITRRPIEPNYFMQLINKYRVTIGIVTPALLSKLVNCETGSQYPNDTVQVLLVGGQPLSKQLYERAKSVFPNCNVCVTYASTESCNLSLNTSNKKCESAGQLYGNVKMKIIDDSGNHLGPGEVGEIVTTADTIFSGYLNDPIETAQTIRNGWIHTGDVGYIDEEGFLFIVDRKKNLYKYEWTKVSATELEFIIDEIPDVDASAVVGIYQDEIGNDLIIAFVVKRPNSILTEKFVEGYVAERVVPNKTIRGGVHFVDRIPLTNTGKIRREEVKRWAVEKFGKTEA